MSHLLWNSTHSFSQYLQAQLNADLPTLRVLLDRHLKNTWLQSVQAQSAHHYLLNGRRSHLSWWLGVPQALQTLYSRWHLGEVKSTGRYPRRLKWILSPACHACGHPIKTTVHLLTDCPGTSSYRALNSISVTSLVSETPADIVSIAQFDAWIRHTFPFDQPISDFGLGNILATTTKKRRLLSPRVRKTSNSTNQNDVGNSLSFPIRAYIHQPHHHLENEWSLTQNAGEEQHAFVWLE